MVLVLLLLLLKSNNAVYVLWNLLVYKLYTCIFPLFQLIIVPFPDHSFSNCTSNLMLVLILTQNHKWRHVIKDWMARGQSENLSCPQIDKYKTLHARKTTSSICSVVNRSKHHLTVLCSVYLQTITWATSSLFIFFFLSWHLEIGLCLW